jgi:signal transduction histidine kinase
MDGKAKHGTWQLSLSDLIRKGALPAKSIRWQLVITLIVSQLLLAGGLLWIAVYFTHRQLRSAFDAGLYGRATSVAALVRYSEGSNPTLFFASNLAPVPGRDWRHDLFQVRSSDGRVIGQSSNWPEGLESAGVKKMHWNLKVGRVSYRAVRLENMPVLDRELSDSTPDVTLTIVYAAPTREMDERVAQAGLYIAIGSILLLITTVPVAMWGVRRALEPLRDLVASAASVGAYNWEFQMPTTATRTAEIVPLARAMTTMVDDLREAFTQQREFIANAAHELRTPVTVLKTNLELLSRKRRTVDEYREGTEDALEDAGRLEHLVQSMLRLARADQLSAEGVPGNIEIVDVCLTCQAVMERLVPFARERHVNLSYSGDEQLPVRARVEDLDRIWSNLLENAIRYSPPHSCIEFRARRTEDAIATVTVEDHGSGIPASELPHIFDRFHRGDASRARQTGGYGLGLVPRPHR